MKDNDDKAEQRAKLIRKLQEDNKDPLTPAEIRQQVTSYIAAEMDGYPLEKIEEYMNKNYGEIPS